MVSNDLVDKVTSWEVLEDEPLSPHKYLLIEIEEGIRRVEHEKWIDRPMHLGEFKNMIRELVATTDEDTPEKCHDIIQQAYISTTRKVRTKNGYVPQWWTEDIPKQRDFAQTARRALTTARKRDRGTQAIVEECEEKYKRIEIELNKMIRHEKRKWWRRLSDELEEDLYGDGYKITVRALKGSYSSTLTKEEKQRQTDVLFPVCNKPNWDYEEVAMAPPFGRHELDQALARLKKGRASEPDGIPTAEVKAAAEACPEYMLNGSGS